MSSDHDPLASWFELTRTYMSHHCHHLVIHCMDFRLQNSIVLQLKLKGLFGDCDVVSWPGAIKDFVSPTKPEYREHMFEPIAISYEKHGARKITLMQHMDCGAYGGKGAFEGETKELERHTADMRQAAAMIKERWADVEVNLIVIMMSGDAVTEFKQVK